MKTYINSRSYNGPKRVTIEYSSLEQFIADISTNDYPRQSSQKEDYQWSGSRSIATAITEAREGLDLGVVDLGIIKNEHLHDFINRAVYAVAGGSVDIGKFLTGEPECMVDFQTEEAPRFVTLNVDVTESSSTRTEVFRRKATAIACLVDELENNGFRVRLNVVLNEEFHYYSSLERLLVMITIKDYQQKLSIAQVTGCVSQGFFRRLLFCLMEKHLPFDPAPCCYGHPGHNYEGIEGVVIKNTRNGLRLDKDADIKPFIKHYTEQIYQLSYV